MVNVELVYNYQLELLLPAGMALGSGVQGSFIMFRMIYK